ncbi:phosphoribosyltransferase family protein [Streptomyces sp. NPDC002454]
MKGKHVLVVEDIIDSGLTLSWLISNLGSRGLRQARTPRVSPGVLVVEGAVSVSKRMR